MNITAGNGPLSESIKTVSKDLTREAGSALAVAGGGATQEKIVASAYGKGYFSSIHVIETDSSGLTISVNISNWGLGVNNVSTPTAPLFGGPNSGLSNVSLTLLRNTVIYGKFTSVTITGGTGKILGYLAS